MSNEYTRPFYEIVCGLNNYKLGTIIESETGQRYKLTKTDNDYRKFSRTDKGLRFLTYENMNKKFRIVEEQEEIDIQSIEETKFENDGLEYYKYANGGYTEDGYTKNYSLDDIETRKLINQLVQAVKQLDKNIKEK